MASAMRWVSQLTTISLEMVLPGRGGYWLDQRWGTKFCVIVGFSMGLALGMWQLLRLTSASSRSRTAARSKGPRSHLDAGE
jgi:hypothetical protein